MLESTGSWRPIDAFTGDDYERVDLWLHVWASPRSMGLTAAYRVIDAYRKGGLWFDGKGQLEARYITHWMPTPAPPPPTAAEVAAAEEVIARSKGSRA